MTRSDIMAELRSLDVLETEHTEQVRGSYGPECEASTEQDGSPGLGAGGQGSDDHEEGGTTTLIIEFKCQMSKKFKKSFKTMNSLQNHVTLMHFMAKGLCATRAKKALQPIEIITATNRST
jgi:hypothetical protein